MQIPSVLLPAWFQRQVAATPDAVAVLAGDTRLTYAELNARANRLAHHLIGLGAGPGHLVAVRMARSADLVVAFLGVLKAGAAYLPVDRDNPPQRTAFMLSDAGPSVLLTDGEDEPGGIPSVSLDDPGIARRPDHNPTDEHRLAPLRPDSPAYVIYTSGSTGTPKGVLIEHGPLVAYLAYACAQYPGTRGRAVLHSSVAFDMTITTLYAPLVSGGCVVISALEDLTTAPDFLKVTPSHMALLPTLDAAAAPTTDLVVGGEMLLGEVVAEFRRSHPGVTVVNEYGPTEATVGCCVLFSRPGDEVVPGPVAIGRPTWTTDLHVLDDRLRPVDDGELYIGGGQLARGYLNRPGLTAERFVANPFGEPGSRMYRTGDRVRRTPGGDLEFLGRFDGQVKIRGYRIELGEIESVLLRHPDVGRAAVTVHEQHVVGYVVAATGGELDVPQLRKHAAETLPEYMVPSVFVELAELPLNANGKLEARRLPAPRFGTDTPFRAPRTATQTLICELFAEFAGADGVIGVDDDFFALGGTSLGAAQVANEARKRGLRFGVKDVMTARTAAKLAETPH